jgi:hypothetical protein
MDTFKITLKGTNIDTWEQLYIYKCNNEGLAMNEQYIN